MTNLQKHFFTKETKMADAILQNYTLLSVLPRFDIELGFGEKNIQKICTELEIDVNFFLLVCNIHTFNYYNPSKEDLENINLQSVIQYLEKSHRYYTQSRINSIEGKLDALEILNPGNHHQIVKDFFHEYKNEILNHFDYEENEIFPYIYKLINKEIAKPFHIDQYEENHDNINDKLVDLKNIFIKYLPANYTSEERTHILNDIFLFEDDLSKHTRIEERVLIPIVKSIEYEYEN